MRTDWDAIVVGLGGIGSGAAYWLSRRFGEGVLGLEQFELGHQNGASQDHSRIIRLSYHRPDYVRLAKRAYETWAEVEAASGETIVTKTGGLDVAPHDASIPLADYTASMTAERVPFEELDAGEIMRRWPEIGPAEQVIRSPHNPYTQALVSVAPTPEPPTQGERARRTILAGETPDAAHIPAGCRFNPRCPYAFDRCRVEEPPLFDVGGGQSAACWLAEGGRSLPMLQPRPNLAAKPAAPATA